MRAPKRKEKEKEKARKDHHYGDYG